MIFTFKFNEIDFSKSLVGAKIIYPDTVPVFDSNFKVIGKAINKNNGTYELTLNEEYEFDKIKDNLSLSVGGEVVSKLDSFITEFEIQSLILLPKK